KGLMFRSGDIGRFNADGYIEFLGRKDYQVKVRGTRIEPKEIELALESHEKINQAQVGEWENEEGEVELVAWITFLPEIEETPNFTVIRNYLSRILPSFMMPSKIVSLPEFPLTSNGKIDRQRLPEPTLELYRSDLPYSPPRDELEETLSQIWKDVLDVPKVSLFDDFFELGGQSILAVQMIGKVQDTFQINLKLSQLFDTSTLIEMAESIRFHKDYEGAESDISLEDEEANNYGDGFEYLVIINQGDAAKYTPFYCVHGAGGNVTFLRKWQPHLDDIPFFAFRARGIEGTGMPHESVVEMASDYLNELLQQSPKGPWILGGFSGGGVIALEMALQLEARGFEKPPVILLDTFHPGSTPKNSTMRDRVHLLTTNPVDYVKSLTQNSILSHFQKDPSSDDLNHLVTSGQPLSVEMQDDYTTGRFAQLLELYHEPNSYKGEVLLLCAQEIWQIFSHAGLKRGWEDTLRDLTVVEVPGDHFSIIEEPLVEGLINQISIGVQQFSKQKESTEVE
ncbi:MAG: thioesterase domain-containing protein, partial [Chloroflexota bacterium]